MRRAELEVLELYLGRRAVLEAFVDAHTKALRQVLPCRAHRPGLAWRRDRVSRRLGWALVLGEGDQRWLGATFHAARAALDELIARGARGAARLR